MAQLYFQGTVSQDITQINFGGKVKSVVINDENREGKLSNYYGGITLQYPPPVGLKGINVINDRIKFNFHNLNDVEIYKDETLPGVSSNGVFETVLNNPYGQYKFKSKIGNVYNNREENLSLNNLSKLTKEGLGL